jgi:tetratricopeptide (TPR) repeat protein
MSVDPYAPCPCGSGKKVKFCCQAILPEMEKVERLLENNQPRMALQTLEKLLPDHPGNAWIATALGWALLADQKHAEAKAALAQFLRKNPDHPSANALHALAAFQADGFPASKKAIHRAFRRSFKAEPSIVAGLAASMAEVYLNMGQVLAGRQHFALALRYGDEQDRRDAFQAMVEIDGDTSIAYPLRGVHNTPAFTGSSDTNETVMKAHRLSAVGCWEEAAETLEPVVASQPDSADGWLTLGLFRAWDGNPKASEALHKAAQLSTNFETAVEWETLAQLLEPLAEGETVVVRTSSSRVESVSRLLTKLDEHKHLMRVPQAVLANTGLADFLAAQYEVLDRPSIESADAVELDDLPRIVGQVMVLNAPAQPVEGGSAMAVVTGLEGDDFAAVSRIFSEAAGDTAGAPREETEEERRASRFTSKERYPLETQFAIPPGSVASTRDRIGQAWHARSINEIWAKTPLKALGGKSPTEAKGVAELRVPLAAAINVLDAFCDSRSRTLNVNELRQQYDLPAMEPMDLPADENVNVLSLMQLRRVNLKSLSDDQFKPLLRRVMLSRHNLHAYETLREYIENRGHLVEEMPQEREQALEALVDVCQRTLRRDEAIKWAQHGQTMAKSAAKPFNSLLTWKMKELIVRLQDRQDPGLKTLFDELWNHFGPKLPQLRDTLRQLGAMAGLEPPGPGVVAAESTLGDAGAGLQLEPASAGESKKLWLPGQD